VLVGLGTPKAAGRFAEAMHFDGTVAVDVERRSYVLMGWEKQPDNWKGLSAASEAGAQLKAAGHDTSAYTWGDGFFGAIGNIWNGGVTAALQNGGILAVRGGRVALVYRCNGSWDMLDGQELLARLA
jgi:hypothetical protein